jgi:hypothetical protein
MTIIACKETRQVNIELHLFGRSITFATNDVWFLNFRSHYFIFDPIWLK